MHSFVVSFHRWLDFADTMRFIEKRYIIALLICFLNGLTYLIYIEFNRSLEWLITSNVSTSRDRRTIARTLDKSQSAVMVGYLLTPVPGAFVVNRYGGVMVLGFTMLLYAVLVVLVDNLTSINFFQLLTIRLIEGVLNSMRCSALADVWARWCTQQDRSRYISTSILGSQIIRLAYYSFLGKIFSKLERDLDQIFLRGTAIACGIWAAIWLSLCKNDPSEDKHLSDNERAILQPRLKYLDEKGVSWNGYPWQEILKSKPLWTLIGISFISGITNDQLHKHLPDFMRIPILEDDDASSPVVPRIKSVFVTAGVLMAAYIVDKSRNHSLYTTTMVHKFIICGGFMVQAILLLIIHFFFPTFKLYAILEAFVTLASMIIEYDVRVNVLDLSLRYASLVNGIRCASSMTSRMFDNAFINEEKEDWLAFFIIISIFYAIGALIYYIWGSGEVQPWNSISSKNSNNATVIWKSIEEDNEKLID